MLKGASKMRASTSSPHPGRSHTSLPKFSKDLAGRQTTKGPARISRLHEATSDDDEHDNAPKARSDVRAVSSTDHVPGVAKRHIPASGTGLRGSRQVRRKSVQFKLSTGASHNSRAVSRRTSIPPQQMYRHSPDEKEVAQAVSTSNASKHCPKSDRDTGGESSEESEPITSSHSGGIPSDSELDRALPSWFIREGSAEWKAVQAREKLAYQKLRGSHAEKMAQSNDYVEPPFQSDPKELLPGSPSHPSLSACDIMKPNAKSKDSLGLADQDIKKEPCLTVIEGMSDDWSGVGVGPVLPEDPNELLPGIPTEESSF